MLATLTLLLAATAPVAAAETVGSALSANPVDDGQTGTVAVQTRRPTGASIPSRVSATGVITSLRIKHAGVPATPGSLIFRIVSQTEQDYFTARIEPQLDHFPIPPAAASPLVVVPRNSAGQPRGVPIAAGEHVAMGHTGGDLKFIATNVAGSLAHYSPPQPAIGIPQGYSAVPGWEVLLQYTVEPDTDRDQYGDESQDLCIDLAGPNAGCPSAPVGTLPVATCASLPATITGTESADTITGTPDSDVIASLGGDDVVNGGGGNDVICGGIGNDVLKGQAGRDKLIGGSGRDVCKGGPATDRARGCEKARTL